MKSLQSKILLVILACVLFAAGVNTVAGVYITSKKMDSDATTILNLVCEKSSEELNSIFYADLGKSAVLQVLLNFSVCY